MSAFVLIWFTKSTKSGHLSERKEQMNQLLCLRPHTHAQTYSPTHVRHIPTHIHTQTNKQNQPKNLCIYTPLSVIVSKAEMALIADRFSSSCFSNSCLTELALALDWIVTLSGSMSLSTPGITVQYKVHYTLYRSTYVAATQTVSSERGAQSARMSASIINHYS